MLLKQASILSGASLLFAAMPTLAEVALDDSFGPARALPGPNYVIDAAQGRTRDRNLFHSFSQFNIFQGQTVTFTGPAEVVNIISRVTGGNASVIDGVLRSQIENANVFLINPAGVIFGPNAIVGVGGSFHVSTADYLKFQDGAEFYAATGPQSELTSAALTDFGFLGAPRGIEVLGSAFVVAPTKTLSLVAGDIDATTKFFLVPGGSLQIASVGSAGEVPIDLRTFDSSQFAELGAIRLSGMNFARDEGGTGRIPQPQSVVIRGRDLSLDSAQLLANTDADFKELAGFDIALTGDLVLANSLLQTSFADIRLSGKSLTLKDVSGLVSGTADGNAGGIALDFSESINLNEAFINTAAVVSGRSGDITLRAPLVNLAGGPLGGAVVTASAMVGSGASGNISIEATDLRVVGGSAIRSSAFGAGNGGNIDIRAARSVVVSSVSADPISEVASETFGGGSAGDIVIDSPNVLLSGGAVSTSAVSVGSAITGGKAGSITLNVGQLTLQDTGLIQAGTSEATTGHGGNVSIDATQAVVINGRASIINAVQGSGAGGRIVVKTPSLSVLSTSEEVFGFISSATTSSAAAGSIQIEANSIQLRGGIVSTGTVGSGPGGDISVNAADVLLTGNGGFISDTIADGRAGNVTVEAGALVLMDGGQITAEATGFGDAGHIAINARALLLSGTRSTVASSTVASGSGGVIDIQADNLLLAGGARIQTTSLGDGDAGNISLQVKNDLRLVDRSPDSLDDQTGILTDAERSTGGSIAVSVGGVLTIDNSRIESSVGSASGKGGDINIQAQSLRLERGQILATADQGNGGAINIQRLAGAPSGRFLIDSNSVINADSNAGVSGEINIDPLDTDDDSVIEPLEASFKPVTLEDGGCRPRYVGAPSTFVKENGIPTLADRYLASWELVQWPVDLAATRSANPIAATQMASTQIASTEGPSTCGR